MSNFKHAPVLFQEALEALLVVPNGIYIDCTYGRGGHSTAILQQLSSMGKLIVIDKDPSAIADAKQRFAQDERVVIEHASFADLATILNKHDLTGKVFGILFDLGVSSPQFDDESRGFSFRNDGPLDMRMNVEQGMNAAEWLADVKEEELIKVLKEYGEERFAKRIARKICEQRTLQPITRTTQLAELVRSCYPKPKWGMQSRIDPATRTFQAIRIFINQELFDLEKGLDFALEGLQMQGRLVVISFHSLEDRIVKRFIRRHAKGHDYPKEIPIMQADLGQRLKIMTKPIRAQEQEVNINPRSRSAIMRVAEKMG